MAVEGGTRNLGLLGELRVEAALVEHGWHPVRLDTAQMASNADLFAINREKRVSIQVKTTDSIKQNSRSQWLGFGYATNYLSGKSIFNSKESPLIADVVVGVNYQKDQSRFFVMPVAFAEKLCRYHVDFWRSVPRKADKEERSSSFPIYLCLNTPRATHHEHDEKIMRNLVSFENRWDVLDVSVDKLHNPRIWKLR